MFKLIKTAALSALIGIGAIGALGVAPASAQSGVYLGLGGGHHGPSVGVWFGGSNGHSYHRPHRPHRPGYGRACTTRQAVNKAGRMGIRRAHARNVNRNVIKVSGRSRGDRIVVRFARAPGCPVIGYR